MMRLIKANKTIRFFSRVFIFLTLVMLILPSVKMVYAGNITLQEAIEVGLEQNSELKSLKTSLVNLNRNQEMIKTGEEWQLSMGIEQTYTLEDNDSEFSAIRGENPGLSASKTFLSGLTINPEVSMSLNDLSPDFALHISQQLYPLPSAQARQYYQNEKEILKTAAKLSQEKAAKVLSWIENYLSLSRQQEKERLYQARVGLARKELEKVLENQSIAEAGESEVLSARINLEGARYSLKDLQQKIARGKLSLYQELGLKEGQGLNFQADAGFIKTIKEQVQELLETANFNQEEYLPVIEKNNLQLIANRLEQELIKEELKWEKLNAAPRVTAGGDYDSINNEFKLSLSLQLSNGSQQKNNVEDKETELADQITSYNDLCNSLKLQLKQQLDKVELTRSGMKQEELKVKKAVYEEEIGKEQLKLGLIREDDYQQLKLSREDSELNLATIQDQLLINQMQLAIFIRPIDFLGGLQ